MIKNYLRTAIRYLSRNRLYTFVSIIGLSLGISCTILIALYIQDEYSFEAFQSNKSNIYRISHHIELGSLIEAAVTNTATGPTLMEEFPEIENYVRIIPSNATVTVSQQIFQEQNVLITDSSFFDFLSFNLIQGDVRKVLRNPNTVVLSESLAKKYFGEDDPLGKTLKMNNSFVTVDGVVEDAPANTEFQYTALRPFSAIPKPTLDVFNGDWYRLVCYTYVLTSPGFSPEVIYPKLDAYYDKYIKPFQESNGVAGVYAYGFDPLEGLHFDNSKEYDLPRGNVLYIYIFGAVAVFILVIACINFINLALSQSGKRSKEVGVRKTLGAQIGAVRLQFLGESSLISFISLLIGLALVELLLPIFNQLTQKEMLTTELLSRDSLLMMFGIFVVVVLLSGAYPAFVLGKLDPIHVLKGQTPRIGRHGLLRRVLVVVQFVFSLGMITGTVVVFQQFKYMKEKDLGFNKAQVALINLPSDTSIVNRAKTYGEQIAKIPGVVGVSHSGNFPGNNVGELLFRIEQQGLLKEKGIKFMSVDEHFIDLYGIELQQGRNFNRERTTDQSSAFIINQTAAKAFGWTDEALGKRMQWGLMANNTAANDGEVVGVVKDFNFSSLHNPIEPFVLLYNPQQSQLISFRIEAGKLPEVLQAAEAHWEQFAGIYPFAYKFVDEQFDQLYQKEERLLSIFGYFATLSILIAILGLFALSSFTIELRIKEIGIRKILGASVPQIIKLLCIDFLSLVLFAALVAMPLSYYFMNRWLQGFAYSISINVFILIGIAFAALFFAFGVITWHGFNSARANPIKALRTD